MREVAEHELHLPGVDVFLLQPRLDVLPEHPARRALVVAELDDQDLGVRAAEHRVVVDADERRRAAARYAGATR